MNGQYKRLLADAQMTFLGWFLQPFGVVFLVSAFPVLSFVRWLYARLPQSKIDAKGKTVVITGASSGIGQYMAYEYAKRGANIVLAARREQKLKEVGQECRRRGASTVEYVKTDVTVEDDCSNLIQQAVRMFGGVDILVNNAGTAESGLFEEYGSASSYKNTLDTDFWGNTLTTFYALPHLKQSTVAQVVVTASVAAYTTYPKQTFYNAAKAAVTQFYDTLRVENPKLTVTVAMPGFVKSELTTRGTQMGHIPSWWPMLGTEEAAKEIVKGSLNKKRYIIVPGWYKTWLMYRLFVPEVVDKSISVFLLGIASVTKVPKASKTA